MAASCARSLVLASLGIAMVASRPISAITMSSSMRVKPLAFIAMRPFEDQVGSTTFILDPARASLQAIASWKANVVRVPLNETCWLGINGVASAYSGDNYRRAIAAYVALLNRTGLAVILDLHWTAAGTAKALAQAPMPNRDHTPDFWRQVAAAYKGNNSVIFDLFNEPFPDNNSDTPEAWRCWRDGGTCGGMSFQAAGMQELVDAVRSTGAANVILLGGVQYSATLSSWVASKPTDPLNNLAA